MQNIKLAATTMGSIIRCAIGIALIIPVSILVTQIVAIICGIVIALVCIPLPFLLDPLVAFGTFVSTISGILVSTFLMCAVFAYKKQY